MYGCHILVISICILLLTLKFSWKTSAQTTCCGDEPPIANLSNPTMEAWPYGATVSVVIYDTDSSDARGKIDFGIRSWNSLSTVDCSGVTFNPATQAGSTYNGDDSTLATNTIWVVRPTPGPNGHMDVKYTGTSTSRTVRAAKMEIKPGITENSTGMSALDHTAAHEIGHSFGLWNEGDRAQSSPIPFRSVMGLAAFPTSCDRDAVKRIYCPPSTSPTPCPSPSITPVAGCYHALDFTTYPSTGCDTGFAANGDFCDRDSTYQSSCAGPDGYDAYSCTCPSGFATPTPEPEWCLPLPGWHNGCNAACNEARSECEQGGNYFGEYSCTCEFNNGSPILVDTKGNGFELTDAAAGVPFDLDGDGAIEQRAWTRTGTDDAWLALDRNGNGSIDNGQELFGNYTPQPDPSPGVYKNGFLALAVFDDAANGGNGDGVISRSDSVFSSLRLWKDANHDGISQPTELIGLTDSGVNIIELDYHTSKRVDEYGNQFRYRAKVRDTHGRRLGRWAWDVYLVSQ